MMYALTLTQPWASLVASGQKLVENRSWKPWRALIGQRFAIHASKVLDMDTVEDIFIDKLYGPATSPYQKPRDFPLGAVVGVATLERFIALQYERELSLLHPSTIPAATISEWNIGDQLRWFFGPVGFVLVDVRAIATPVPCRGAQGFWKLPADVEYAVLDQLASAA